MAKTKKPSKYPKLAKLPIVGGLFEEPDPTEVQANSMFLPGLGPMYNVLAAGAGRVARGARQFGSVSPPKPPMSGGPQLMAPEQAALRTAQRGEPALAEAMYASQEMSPRSLAPFEQLGRGWARPPLQLPAGGAAPAGEYFGLPPLPPAATSGSMTRAMGAPGAAPRWRAPGGMSEAAEGIAERMSPAWQSSARGTFQPKPQLALPPPSAATQAAGMTGQPYSGSAHFWPGVTQRIQSPLPSSGQTINLPPAPTPGISPMTGGGMLAGGAAAGGLAGLAAGSAMSPRAEMMRSRGAPPNYGAMLRGPSFAESFGDVLRGPMPGGPPPMLAAPSGAFAPGAAAGFDFAAEHGGAPSPAPRTAISSRRTSASRSMPKKAAAPAPYAGPPSGGAPMPGPDGPDAPQGLPPLSMIGALEALSSAPDPGYLAKGRAKRHKKLLEYGDEGMAGAASGPVAFWRNTAR